MPTMSKKASRYIKRKVITNSSKPSEPTNSAMGPSSRSLYTSIAELPLYVFVDCHVHNKLSKLIIEGEYSKEELQAAWANILMEYSEAVGGNESRLYLNLFNETISLDCEYRCVKLLVSILKQNYHKEFADELNELLQTSFVFDPENREGYIELLDGCLMRSQEIKMNLEIKQVQFEAMESKNKNPGKKPNQKYYSNILITLSDHAKYQLTDRIMLYEFCERIRRVNEYFEAMKKHKK